VSRPVYSERLGLRPAVFGPAVPFVVGLAGSVVVVKWVSMSVGITTGGYTVGVYDLVTGAFVLQDSDSSLTGPPTTYEHSQLHVVLYEGDTLMALATSCTADFYAGGFVLALP
jgi:hypothetical protein